MPESQLPEPIYLADEAAMCTYAQTILALIEPGDVVYFEGDLGAGKTTLVRAMIQALGYTGCVNSPTYTLIESYPLNAFTIHHFDLYRLETAEELEAIGARECFNADSVCLIEWPYRVAGFVPSADIQVNIEHLIVGRRVSLQVNKTKTKSNC